MIEKVYEMTFGNEKLVEKIIQDENVHYIHMTFNINEGLPEHYSNSNVYMTVLRGCLSIGLNDEDVNEYTSGSVLKIPFNTKMNVRNLHEDVLDIIVIKAPAPMN